jgi:hypothetical protein
LKEYFTPQDIIDAAATSDIMWVQASKMKVLFLTSM